LNELRICRRTADLRVFVYEFVTGGGFLDRLLEEIPGSLLAEGTAMRDALASDFAAIPGVQVDLICDARLKAMNHPGVIAHGVASLKDHERRFDACARDCDWSVIIAPEMGGTLERLARRVLLAGGRLLGPSPDVIALAADKHRLAEHLLGHGMRAPRGVELGAAASLPRDFHYPAVLKPVDGCGSLCVQFVESADAPLVRGVEISSRWRLEEYCDGVPASVSLLCGPGVICALPACRQSLSDDGRFTYLGGRLPLGESPTTQASAAVRERLRRLAECAVGTLGDICGYVGVDLVLGRDGHSSKDTVIEINPRLTTSYVGLRAASRVNLAQAMLDAANGRPPILSFDDQPVRFSAAGETRQLPFAEQAT
jgi:predicted ATP-grasp superfamily ATP-dependent carboligase